MCNNEHSHSNIHHHHHEIKSINRVFAAILILIMAAIIPFNETVKFLLYLIAYIISGYDVVLTAVKNLFKGNLFDENFLMSIATIGAFCINEYCEAVCVMALYQIGEFLQNKAVIKSRNSIKNLMNIMPEYANIEENGIISKKNPELIKINDIIIVKPGEKIPIDGKIIDGHSYLDTSSLTGESVLKEVKPGDDVLSGCVNSNAVLKIRTSKLYKESTVSKIMELVENAGSRKSKTENFITKFAKYYTPAVVICACLLVLIPFTLYGISNINIWYERALTFLVISCPCALVLSVPLTFFGAIGAASKCGILIKGSSFIELLSNSGIIVFDKTGTLTKGTFKISQIHPVNGISLAELLEYTAYAENNSNHPAAVSVKKEYGKPVDNSRISSAVDIFGYGVKAVVDDCEILAGNKNLMDKYAVEIPELNQNGTIIYTARNNKFMGYIIISDEIKDNAANTIAMLDKFCIKTIMFTGDSDKNAQDVSNKINIKMYKACLLPSDKVKELEKLISDKPKKKSLIFVGDGINDAPALMRSDIGIAMGALGSDAAVEAADVVIADDNLSKIYILIKLAKKAMKIAKQNIVFAIGVKVLFLLLGVFGFMTIWGAVFADVGVTLISVLNSLRTLKITNS